MTSKKDRKNERVKEEDAAESGKGSRARNRTVMLTPDITNEVRARLAKDMGAADTTQDPVEDPDAFQAPAGVATESYETNRTLRESSSSTPREERKPPKPQFTHYQEPLSEDEGVAPSERTKSSNAGGKRERTPSAARIATPVQPVTPPAAYRIRQGIIWSKQSRIMGFLVSYDEEENGEFFELRQGRLIITSEPPASGNFLVLDDESVSPMHAIVRIADFGELQVLDQLSEHGTRIIRGDTGEEESLSGDKSTVRHGDTIFFGKKQFSVCLISRGHAL
ncbi:hypothetical protein EBR25_02770 [bacterium]|nr:hypothetical protein [bacterium]